jgi:hypothetical protein
MTKESLVLLLLVAATAVGILYVVRKASSNEDEWEAYRKVRIGDAYMSVRERFSSASDDISTMADARAAGYSTALKSTIEKGGTKLFVAPSRDDVFIFGFDKDDRLVHKEERGNE